MSSRSLQLPSPSAYKGVVISPSLTKTAGGQDLYVPLIPSAGGGDVIPGNLQVVGNLAVGGTSTLTDTVSTGALTSASVTSPGQISGATVVSAGQVSGASVVSAGPVTASLFQSASQVVNFTATGVNVDLDYKITRPGLYTISAVGSGNYLFRFITVTSNATGQLTYGDGDVPTSNPGFGINWDHSPAGPNVPANPGFTLRTSLDTGAIVPAAITYTITALGSGV
jgi:hypothetical protein